MTFYDITYILEDEQQNRLSALAKRLKKLNGWEENDMLQFAVTALIHEDVEMKLRFLERKVTELEKDKLFL